MSVEQMIHPLWGKAKDGPGYVKEEWKVLQRAIETLEAERGAMPRIAELVEAAEASLEYLREKIRNGDILNDNDQGVEATNLARRLRAAITAMKEGTGND